MPLCCRRKCKQPRYWYLFIPERSLHFRPHTVWACNILCTWYSAKAFLVVFLPLYFRVLLETPPACFFLLFFLKNAVFFFFCLQGCGEPLQLLHVTPCAHLVRILHAWYLVLHIRVVTIYKRSAFSPLFICSVYPTYTVGTTTVICTNITATIAASITAAITIAGDHSE